MDTLLSSVPGQATPDPTPPEGFGLVFATMMVLGLFFYALQAIGLGQIALRGRGVLEAFGDGMAGALRNVLPLLLFGAVMVLAGIAMVLVFSVAAAVLALLGDTAGAWVALLLGLPLYLAFLLALLVVVFGVMYFLWRDIAGGGDLPAGNSVAA
jgi:hypothetical protein